MLYNVERVAGLELQWNFKAPLVRMSMSRERGKPMTKDLWDEVLIGKTAIHIELALGDILRWPLQHGLRHSLFSGHSAPGYPCS